MSFKTPVKIILGTHTVGDPTEIPGIAHFDSAKQVQALLDVFHSRGYRHIDTASNYFGSEVRLGQAGAASRFTIHTKVAGFGKPGDHEPSKIDLSIGQSLDALETSVVETMFLHVPDRQTPFKDTAKAMNDAFRQVLQPVFFSGNTGTSTRWKHDNIIGKLYSTLYGHPAVQASVAVVRDAAEKHGISGHAAAVRWTAFHSVLDGKYGDGLIFAVSKMEQLYKTLDALEAGPLSDDLAEAITAIYGTLDGAEPPYHL
ncbi:NADP-dependent oxidoreductase domain-containing protein [Lipomyces kononenkoae]